MKILQVPVADLSHDPANARKRLLPPSVYSIDNAGNVTLGNTVTCCNLTLCLAVLASLPNIIYLLISKLCHRVAFAKVPDSVPVAITSVFRQTVPHKIAKAIVRWNTVFMSALHSRRALANKRLQNKPMNPSRKRLSILPKADVQVPGFSLFWLEFSPYRTFAALKVTTRPNATIIANAIPWEVNQGFVFCVHAVSIPESQYRCK